MIDNQLVEEVIKKLFSVQNKLKNALIVGIFDAHFKSYNFEIDDFSSSINEYIEYKDKLYLFNEIELSNLFEELNNFLDYTSNENKMLSNKVAVLDSINIIISYFNKLKGKPTIKVKVIEQLEISEDEFSKRYDKLINFLKYENENSNLELHTPNDKIAFKLYKNKSNTIVVEQKSGNKYSVTKDKLINRVYKQKGDLTNSYDTAIIEELLSNTRYLLPKDDDFNKKIIELEKKNFEVLGQFSELKNLFEKREAEFSQMNEVLEKSKTLKSEFDNAKEAVLKNIELKQATTYWEKQAEKYDEKYKFYFRTNIGIAVCLIAITFYLINFTGLFITNITDSADKKTTEIISQVAHSASFFNYIIFIMFTTIMIWMMKILVKLMLSNYHLAVDANERVIMINTYLVLLEDGKGFQENDRKVILDNIFRQTNHGIITDETSVTIADIVSSLKK